MSVSDRPPLLDVLDGRTLRRPPIWLMRQAGRYLPEYREVRAKAGSFLNLCYSPELAAEVTLQPIRRFGFDGAILFSDILVVPDALGQKVRFVEGEGPRLDPVTTMAELDRLKPEVDLNHLEPVFETIRLVKAALPKQTTFLGFCGAPFTVASYMVAGQGTPDQGPARSAARLDPTFFGAMIDRLVESSIAYLSAQVDAGVQAVQIFDSWAGVLDDAEFRRWSLEPIARIVDGLKARQPNVRIIAFAKGVKPAALEQVAALGVDAVGLDWTADPVFVRERIQPRVAVQGNLDPKVLVAGGRALDEAIDKVLSDYGQGRHIFNLGHGITPDCPIAHVEHLIRRVREG